MPKARDLSPFQLPPPPEPPTCVACRSFKPEVLVPHGAGAIGMCWLCAHHHVDHGVRLELAHSGECECLPTEIYPRSYFGPTAEAFEAARDAVLERRGLS